MKKITKLVLGCLLMLLIGVNTKSNAQAITNGGFETGSISPWVGSSLVTVSSGFTELSWTIVPSGTGMARIEPTPGTSVLRATAESNLGLTAGSLVALNSSIFGSGPSQTSTNFGTMTQTITLAAGQTIVAYWNYVSRDYTPYNDGFMATLVGPSYQQIKVLAMTANAYGTGAVVTGSYGSTGWFPVTFTAGAAGTYTLGFACWNAQDQGLSPIVSIDNAAGGTSAPGAPVVTTSTITATSCTTATCGGNVTSDGGTFVTAKGVCWNTTGSPTLADSHTTDGTGAGSFTSSITGLGAGTYYVKTYATNSVGTTYGPEVTIATSPTISGTLSMCAGSTSSLTAAGTGTWSSLNTSVATVGTSGIVSGLTAGTAEIKFVTSVCEVSAIVTVNASPAPTGTLSVCVGGTTTLTAGTGGGSWSSGSTGIATVVSGVVTGVSAGTAIISYSNAGCLSTVTVTVNALPSITTEESVYICPAATYTLTASMSGGTWGSSNVAAATVGMTSGIVTGVATGSTSISYTVAGCVSEPFHVGVLPATEAPTVEGESSVCVGSSISLSSSTESGTWSSSNTSVATVEGGMVYGVSGGTAAITYSVTGDCGTAYDAHIVTVTSLPAPISGPSSVCVGSTITLTSSPAGGTWSTYSMLETGPSTAIVDVVSVDETTGVVTGVSAGTAFVTYTAPSGCHVTTVITVEELPASITGTTSVCVGSTTTLSSATAGGSWTSSFTSKATVDASTGVVSGIATGTTSISYTLSSGCRRKTTVTVIATPSSITGSLSLCSGGTTTLSSATTGGSWSSSDDGVASIDASTGIVTGTGTGTATIMYTIGGCSVSAVVTVAGSLTASTGSSVVCVGGSIALSNTTSGGVWSSSDVAIATVTSSGGIVTGVSSGVVSITYTAGAGCYTITNMTVNAAVSDITGTTSVCPGLTTTLSNATSGGSWSSSNETRATVDAGTGVVTG
ncbi:MAG: hypothetical protein K9G49_11750, partial [Taibaiella sp.]|nr:hypothetical protein [Taibaiella sp.]